MKTLRLLLVIFFQLNMTLIFAQSSQGSVLDVNNKPIPFADVYLPDLNTGTTTNMDGEFSIAHATQGNIHLQISFLGYEPIDTIISLKESVKWIFYLKESHFALEEVIVSAPTGKLQRESIVSIEHKRLSALQQTAPNTLAESLRNIPGVEQNTTGTGIGKPIIRGLSGSRIVTYAQGIRIENQQWGEEHGLGVGGVGIESVEVIKGPASLLYGSDALGGVLYFIDERYAKHNTYELASQSQFLMNSLGLINDLGLKIHKNSFKLNVFGSYTSHADYQVPNKKRVANTRFNEKNIKASIGFNNAIWISNLRYSFLQNKFGITEKAALDNSKKRTFVLPFQTIANQNLSFENTLFIRKSKLKAIAGYTSNYRREFEDSRSEQALGLRLNTFSYNLKWHTPVYKEHYSFVLGSQGMLQKNMNDGEEILIPDAQTKDIGVFGLINIEFEAIQFQGGVRFDNRQIIAQATRNIAALTKSYQGITFSGGAVYKKEKSKYRVNLSSGFRAPNTSELLSDGVHEGTNRYEKGNSSLKNENATQIDFSYDYRGEHLQFSINPFFNYIQKYIFLSPTDLLIEADPVFNYLQKDVLLFGGESGIHYHPHQLHWLHLESNLSTVFGQDKAKNPLPLIPQTKINSTVRASFSSERILYLSSCYFQHIHKFRQDRIGPFETLSKAYDLLNLGMAFKLKTKSNPILISTGVKNLANTKYIDHLSRFKNLEISNQGINYYFKINFLLQRSLQTKSKTENN